MAGHVTAGAASEAACGSGSPELTAPAAGDTLADNIPPAADGAGCGSPGGGDRTTAVPTPPRPSLAAVAAAGTEEAAGSNTRHARLSTAMAAAVAAGISLGSTSAGPAGAAAVGTAGDDEADAATGSTRAAPLPPPPPPPRALHAAALLPLPPTPSAASASIASRRCCSLTARSAGDSVAAWPGDSGRQRELDESKCSATAVTPLNT